MSMGKGDALHPGLLLGHVWGGEKRRFLCGKRASGGFGCRCRSVHSLVPEHIEDPSQHTVTVCAAGQSEKVQQGYQSRELEMAI